MNTYMIETDNGPFYVRARSILECVPQFRALIRGLMRRGERSTVPLIQSIEQSPAPKPRSFIIH